MAIQKGHKDNSDAIERKMEDLFKTYGKIISDHNKFEKVSIKKGILKFPLTMKKKYQQLFEEN